MSDDRTNPEPPTRKLRDAEELRAFAHPVRLAIIEQLGAHGPSSATEIAERLQGESPANCSWHLRQLARFGFIEVASTGPGRRRTWQLVSQSTQISPKERDSPEETLAADTAAEVVINREIHALRGWMAARHTESGEWRDASGVTASMNWLTLEEAAALQADIHEVLARHSIWSGSERLDPEKRPKDARLVRLVHWMVPNVE